MSAATRRRVGSVRRVVVASALGLAAALVAFAPRAAHAEPAPRFAELPEAAIPELPKLVNAPDRVEPTERVEGLSVVVDTGIRSGPPMVTVMANDGRCFQSAVAMTLRSVPRDPSLVLKGMVTSMRSERLVVERGAAELEIVDGWVDPATGGARSIARTVVPLAKLGEAPGDFALYAFRHGDTLEVVTPARASLHFQDPDMPLGSPMCDHVRSTLEAKPGGGATMNATAFVELPEGADQTPAPAAAVIPQVQTDEPLVLARLVDVSVGVSRSSTDPAPVLGVTLAWGDDEPTRMPKSRLTTGSVVSIPMPPMMPPEEAHLVKQVRSAAIAPPRRMRMRMRDRE